MDLINLKLSDIIALCKKHKVKTMSVFGSILTDNFNKDSDVDLLVDFEKIDAAEFDYVNNYFGLRDALEILFGRRVDLIEERGIRNKYILSNINRTKRHIYG